MPRLRTSLSLVTCLLFTSFLPAAAQTKATVIAAEHHDASQSLRTLVRVPLKFSGAAIPGEFSEFEDFTQPIKNPSYPDTVVQNSASSQMSLTQGVAIAGVGQGDYGYSDTFPVPDSNGAVGATQYVQSASSSFAVFDKSTGAVVLGPANTNSVFAGFGGACETTQAGDSVIIYDKISNRWVIGTMAQRLPTGEGFNYECVAVSQTSDATGAYYRYSFKLNNIDYQKIGVWPDGYYLGLNNPANTIATTCAMDRTQMLAGGNANIVCFTLNGYNTVLPSDLDGRTLPPAGSPNYFIGGINNGKNVLNLFKFHVDFTNTRNSTLTGPIAIQVAPYTPSCLANGGYYRTCVPQKGSSLKLETLSDRVMYRNAYRNFSDHESIVLNHAVDVNGSAGHSVGLRWYELRAAEDGNFSVYQQGTYAPNSTSRFMGSVAMDGSGDMAIGYAISSTAIYPSMAMTGRLSTDPLGTLEAEKVLFSGASATSNTLWGDYTSMAIDPTDDCTFWYTNEYYKSGQTLNWSTRINSFKFSACK